METITRTRRDCPVEASFLVRPNTSDIKAVDEVWKKNSYQYKTFKIGTSERWLDLGANVGGFSVFAGLKGNEVIAVEAEAQCYQITKENLALNGLGSTALYEGCVMPESYPENHVRFYVHDRPLALRRNSIYEPKKFAEAIDVPVYKVSSLVAAHQPTCVKANIEGVEIPMVLEEPGWISGLDKFVLEWSFDKDKKIATLEKALGILRRNFEHVLVNKNYHGLTEWNFYPPNAFIYCHN